MSWINEHKNIWRMAALVLLLVAIIGPWTYDRINVPSPFPCSLPNVRLDDNFCGIPMSGAWIFLWIAGGLASVGIGLFTRPMDFALWGRDFLFSLLLLLLPFLSTLLVIWRPERWWAFHMVAWGLAAGFGLLLVVSGFSRLAWPLWGVWLYTGLAIGVVELEVLAFVVNRRSGHE